MSPTTAIVITNKPPPPSPWIHRKTISSVMFWLIPQSAEPTRKMTIATCSTILRPYGSHVRDVEDRDRQAPLEEVRRSADLLWERGETATAHAPSEARATARAPRPSSSPDGSSSRCERPPGCRRD